MRKNNQKSGNLFAGFKIMRTFASLLKGSTLTKEFWRGGRVVDCGGLQKSFGEVAEWSIAAVLKTVVPRGTRGSNPCLSAMLIEYSPVEFILWDFFMIINLNF